jgi:hypothetical protein
MLVYHSRVVTHGNAEMIWPNHIPPSSLSTALIRSIAIVHDRLTRRGAFNRVQLKVGHIFPKLELPTL